MISPAETSFAAMTAATHLRSHTAATKETVRARRNNRARMHPTTTWKIAMAYAQKAKVEVIAAELGLSHRHVPSVARSYGLPLRGHKPQPPNPAEVEHMRRWARQKAKALRREAAEWERLATIY